MSVVRPGRRATSLGAEHHGTGQDARDVVRMRPAIGKV
jgi:hypothetical protein